jgi:hypothetical protein
MEELPKWEEAENVLTLQDTFSCKIKKCASPDNNIASGGAHLFLHLADM